MEKFNVVFVLGAPGAGKGTQCEKIAQEFGYTHLSTGGLLRAEKELEELLKEHTRNGTMVPVEISLGLLEKNMKAIKDEDKSKNNFIIDGFPRNHDNKSGWERLMANKTNLQFVLYLDCSEQICIDRCLSRGAGGSGRPDDNTEILKVRMRTYQETTLPIITSYEKQGLLRKIDSNRNVDEVFEDVKKVFLAISGDKNIIN